MEKRQGSRRQKEKGHSDFSTQPTKGEYLGLYSAAPLGAIGSGRLTFLSPATRLAIRGDPGMPELYRAQFHGPVPRIWLQEGSLTIKYGDIQAAGRVENPGDPAADLRLNGAIPWEIELHRGASQLNADLRRLHLRSLDILDGASQAHLALPVPEDTGYLYISGGVRQGSIFLPPEPEIRIQVSGGTSGLVIQGQSLPAVEQEFSLVSPGSGEGSGRYHLCITGGVDGLAILRRSEGPVNEPGEP